MAFNSKDYHLCMPETQRYTCGIAANNVMEGLLHLYVRHHLAFEFQVAGLKAQRLMLPSEMQHVMSSIAKARNIKFATADVADFKRIFNSNSTVRNILYCAQMMLLRFLEPLVLTHQSTTTSNTSGQMQLQYQLKNGRKLVLGVSDIEKPVSTFGDNRRVRYVRTAFLRR